MTAEELLERLKAQLEEWRTSSHPYAFNTSPTGRSYSLPKYAEWVEVVSAEDFKTAFAAFSLWVKEKFAGYSPRYAKSGSGAEYNVWSFLGEPTSSANTRKFNFHVRVKAGENP